MSRQEKEPGEVEEQLAEAQAQIESLQAAAADAEARAATVRGELTAAREELQEAAEARTAVEEELARTAGAVDELQGQLREAAAKYRTARLESLPEVPADLVPPSEDLEEIDRQFEAAQQVVLNLREKMQQEGRTRVPPGSPGRRAPDVSGLSAGEKIRLGLQQLGDG